MKKMLALVTLCLSLSSFANPGTVNNLPRPYMNCFVSDHGLNLTFFKDQFGVLSAQLFNTTISGTSDIASFADVQSEVLTNTLVPTELYWAGDMDGNPMFELRISDPSSSLGLFQGELRYFTRNQSDLVRVHCRKRP